MWPRNYQEAVVWQEALRHRVEIKPLGRIPRLVAGADAAYDRTDRRIYAAVAVFTYPELRLVEEAGVSEPCPFPYIPGLLSFREAPALASAYARLGRRPEVLLVDGQGIAHPRGLGLASHLGVLLEVPTIGVAKSRLVGEGKEPDPTAGSASPLYLGGKTVGLILRSRRGKKPLYISPGHLISLEECRAITLACIRQYRLPLPLRQADFLSRQLRSEAMPAVKETDEPGLGSRRKKAPYGTGRR